MIYLLLHTVLKTTLMKHYTGHAVPMTKSCNSVLKATTARLVVQQTRFPKNYNVLENLSTGHLVSYKKINDAK